MTVQTSMKLIVPKDYAKHYEAAISKEIGKALKVEAAIVRRAFERTTRTWTKRPKFRVWSRQAGYAGLGGKYIPKLSVSSQDEIYYYVSKGTAIRWAVMSQDFRPKTRPRVIGSRTGRGGAVIVGRKAMTARNIQPRPGIKAREFDEEIKKRRTPWFQKRIEKAVAAGAKRAERNIKSRKR